MPRKANTKRSQGHATRQTGRSTKKGQGRQKQTAESPMDRKRENMNMRDMEEE
jgi:hypothetical protein